MKNSIFANLKVKYIFSIAVLFGLAFYLLNTFKNYQDLASSVLNGQEKTVVLGHLAEAKIHSLSEMVILSASSTDSNKVFIEKVSQIEDLLKNMSDTQEQQLVDDVKKNIQALLKSGNIDLKDDVFAQYRNLKATAFNLYRTSWNNKWMNIARQTGLVIQELDNMPYHAAEKGIINVTSKIAALSDYAAKSDIGTQNKIALFGLVNQLKEVMARYSDSVNQADKTTDFRVDYVKKASVAIKKYNEYHTKNLSIFNKRSQEYFVKALLAVMVALLLSFFWYFYVTKSVEKIFKNSFDHLLKQVSQWFTPSGQLNPNPIASNETTCIETEPVFELLRNVQLRTAAIRKEDLIIKKLTQFPYVLITKTRQAIYWNSAFCQFNKSRSVDEMGSVHYSSLLKYSHQNGKVVVDPVEKCFVDRVEIQRSIEILSNQESLPARILVSPVFDEAGEVEYVYVQLRDLRDEIKMIDREIERQLEGVNLAVDKMRKQELPDDLEADFRPAVKKIHQEIKDAVLDSQQQKDIMLGQLTTAYERITREGEIKKSLNTRFQQLTQELESIHAHVLKVDTNFSAMTGFLVESAKRDERIKSQYQYLKNLGTEFQKNIRKQQDAATVAIKSLQKISSLSEGIKNREQLIATSLEKAKIMSANTGILRARPDVSMVEISSILDSMDALCEQFDRSHRYIVQAVSDLDEQYKKLRSSIDSSVSNANNLAQDDRGIIEVLVKLEKSGEESKDDFKNILASFSNIKQELLDLSANLEVSEEKCRKLEKVGTVSLELQEHIEKGFKGMMAH